MRNALAYALLNARRHWRQRTGEAPPVRLDEASSGGWFDGWSREPPGARPTGPRDVAPRRLFDGEQAADVGSSQVQLISLGIHWTLGTLDGGPGFAEAQSQVDLISEGRLGRRAAGAYPRAVDRVVSLLPSTTEIACALGFREALVGRSHECDFPADVAALPALTEAKLDAGASSRAIDERVKALVREGLSVYRVDAERLRELAPDVILTQDHCRVCAASLDDVEAALADWLGAKPRVVSLEPRTLGDVYASFLHVANALGSPERGRELATQLSIRLADLCERARSRPERPRVTCIEWIDPLMAAGNWMPELVMLAGGTPIFGELGEHSPWLAWESLRDADPDVVVVMPCGFDLTRTRAELLPLLAQPGFASLRAVRDGRVYLADGHQYFNRPGPRLVESLEILCELLHPEAFPPAHRGERWQPLPP